MENSTKNERAVRMATKPMVPLVMGISFPLMISLLVQSMYNLVDSYFVARISENALSATSLASPVQILMVAVSVGTGVGVNSLLSRTLGAEKRDDIPVIATSGLVLALLSSAVFMIFGIFFSGGFLRLFTKDAELLQMSHSYLSVCTIFCQGIFVATTAERLLQATGNTTLSMLAQVAGALTNCILDPILIFGYFGLPAMGVRGAAVATVAGQWLAAAVAMLLNFKKNHDIHFDFRHFRFRKEIIGGIYKVAGPAMLANGVTSIQTMCMNKILISFSTTAVAFFGLYHKIQSIIQMPMNGLSQGLIPIAGFSYGAKKGKRLMEAFKVTMGLSLAIMAVGTAVFELLPGPILRLFNGREEMLSMGIPALRILASGFVFISVVSVVGNLFTAMGNGVVNMCCTVIRGLLPLPAVYLIAKSIGIGFVWFAIPAADVLAFLIAALLLWRTYRKQIRPMMEEMQEKPPLTKDGGFATIKENGD